MKIITLRTLYNLWESLGRPRTVLCHTTGKFVRLQKFWVTAIVTSRFSTTCHQPPGTNTVSPGFCSISSCKTCMYVKVNTLSCSLYQDIIIHIDSKGFSQWCVITGFFGHWKSSSNQQTTEHNVSENGSLCPQVMIMISVPSERPNKEGVSSTVDRNTSSFRDTVFSSF
jgi:hypothetical protein